MTQTDVLKNMFSKLFNSLDATREKNTFYENYEYQCELYEKLFDAPEGDMERERGLVCGRCIIALSRSLVGSNLSFESIEDAKRELEILKPLFMDESRIGEKQKIKSLVRKRIEFLSPRSSDEIADAVLFLYLSLAPTAK